MNKNSREISVHIINEIYNDKSFDDVVNNNQDYLKLDNRDKSFYYARVLENPTCRWSTWDAISRGFKPREDLHETIQERAWTSPIWYIPAPSDVDVIPLGGTVRLINLST